MTGGTFTIVLCATTAPSGHGASPSAMPDTATGPLGGGDNGTLPIMLLGSSLLLAGVAYLAIRRRWAIS